MHQPLQPTTKHPERQRTDLHHTPAQRPGQVQKLLITLGIHQKNWKPYHPQAQGKIERFHHTEHLWVNARPRAESITELQRILDEFQQVYNTERPHRALNRKTPHQWYHRTLKARPNLKNITRDREFRIRHDRIDSDGQVTLRHDGRLRHLGARKIHRRKKNVMLIDTEEVTVMDAETSEVLSRHVIDPSKFYWPDKQKSPGRWPRESDNYL